MAGHPDTPMRSARRWSWWEAPDGGVDDEDGDVGALQGAQGPQRRVLLGARGRSWTAGAARPCR